MPNYQLAIAIIIILFVYIMIFPQQESFTTKQDKAKSIYNWFKLNPNPKYVDYRRDLSSASNIVEFEDILTLSQQNNLTLESVEKHI